MVLKRLVNLGCRISFFCFLWRLPSTLCQDKKKYGGYQHLEEEQSLRRSRSMVGMLCVEGIVLWCWLLETSLCVIMLRSDFTPNKLKFENPITKVWFCYHPCVYALYARDNNPQIYYYLWTCCLFFRATDSADLLCKFKTSPRLYLWRIMCMYINFNLLRVCAFRLNGLKIIEKQY